MGVKQGIVEKEVAKEFGDAVTQKMAEYFELQLKAEAQKASKRKVVFKKKNGKVYSYSKYRNTGQLASNIKISKNGKGKKVSDGKRANYSSGYHGMYFLVETKGESAIKKVLKDAEAYAESMKL